MIDIQIAEMIPFFVGTVISWVATISKGSSNKLATSIVRKFGRPITATSANCSGQKTCYTADEVIKQFINKKNQPDLVIDAGRLPQRKTSTVVKIVDKKIDILRKGSVKL